MQRDNIWKNRGSALIKWLDTVKLVENNIGRKVEDMYVKSYTMYAHEQPVTAYITKETVAFKCPTINYNKSLKALDSCTDVNKAYYTKLEAVAGAALLPLGGLVKRHVSCPKSHPQNHIVSVRLDSDGISVTLGYINFVDIIKTALVPITDIGKKVYIDAKDTEYPKWLNMTEGGFVRPVELLAEKGSVVIDNAYLYWKTTNNTPRVVGEWHGDEMEIYGLGYALLDAEIIPSVNSLVLAVKPMKDYIVPEGLLGTHKVGATKS